MEQILHDTLLTKISLKSRSFMSIKSARSIVGKVFDINQPKNNR